MNTQPLVSIAMPVYNAEKYIKKTIDSVLAQTYTNFELIMVNDASKDRSKEIILSYSDPRIVYIENATNQGIVKTRNTAMERANGKYIAVLDNDDIALPGRLEKQVEFLESNDDHGMCGSFYSIIDSAGDIVSQMKTPVTNSEIRTFLLFNNCFCNSSVLIRSKLIKEKMYPEGFDMIEDYYFVYTLSKMTKLSNLPEYTTQYRIHGNNTSISKLDDMRSLRMKMDSLILQEMNIPFSEEELVLHSHFVNGNFDYFKTPQQISELETWLVKLYRFIKTKRGYDMSMVQKIFTRRWVLLFTRKQKVSYRLFFNRLFWSFKTNYIRFFVALLTEKYSKIKSMA